MLSRLPHRMRAAGERRVRERFGAEPILRVDPVVNFFGLESGGVVQVRGNGVLALSRDGLWFSRYAPRMDITIRRQDILAVSLVSSHLGKTVARPLFHVRFASQGREDAAAWFVDDPAAWKELLSNKEG
ncbi:MAG: hypothetical protein JXM73_23630 [Anaerolineae bacterium]|nr:hypothetical protein [Anaerolineae bacterium]